MGMTGSGHTSDVPRVPVQVRESTRNADGRVVVFKPKFGGSRLGHWLGRHLGSPYLRLTLDDLGSTVWTHCDGQHTFEDLVAVLEQQFPERRDNLERRLYLFLGQLQREGLIRWRNVEP